MDKRGAALPPPLVFRLFPGQCERRVSEEVMAQKKVPKGFFFFFLKSKGGMQHLHGNQGNNSDRGMGTLGEVLLTWL